MPRSRDETLALLRGERIARRPVFSGLPSLTTAGLRAVGLRYSETHTDAAKMSEAAATTFELFGFESAVVPFDLCVEAEALGGGVDFQTDVDIILPPVVDRPLNFDEYHIEYSSEMENAGRIPLVAEAIRILRKNVGEQIAIAAAIPGPFTLGWQLFGGDAWISALTKPVEMQAALETTTDFLKLVARFYRHAGADFITVHEMGGSPQAIGVKAFRRFVKPALVELLAAIEPPRVLSMCGDTNAAVRDLARCGADALHFDQRNNLARTRRLIGKEPVLLGNLDPIGVLSRGTPGQVAEAVAQIAGAGADAIWPGCDLWPEIPGENMHALVESARRMTDDG